MYDIEVQYMQYRSYVRLWRNKNQGTYSLVTVTKKTNWKDVLKNAKSEQLIW